MGHNRFPMLSEGATNPLNTPSDKQIEAAEIVDSQQDAFEVVPPDHRRDVVCRLPDRCRDLPELRTSGNRPPARAGRSHEPRAPRVLRGSGPTAAFPFGAF